MYIDTVTMMPLAAARPGHHFQAVPQLQQL